MLLQDMLKIYRKKNHYTQEQVAKKLFVSTQAVSKWETGQSVPSIDNLLALSDLYDISLDQLVQGSPFFKKPYVVGSKYSIKKGLLFLVVLFVFSSLFTGFGYPSFWLAVLIFLFDFVLIFPIAFNDYWIIERDGLRIKNYSTNSLIKLRELLLNNQDTSLIPYSEILAITLTYRTKTRSSPFDIGPDSYYLLIATEQKSYKLCLPTKTKEFLPQFVAYLTRKGVPVKDPANIIQLLIADEDLFSHFNE